MRKKTLCILETPQRVFWQAVKTLMKCSIMLHFIRVCTILLRSKQPARTDIHYNLENSTCDPRTGQSNTYCMSMIRIQMAKQANTKPIKMIVFLSQNMLFSWILPEFRILRLISLESQPQNPYHTSSFDLLSLYSKTIDR